jgi:hypothetical protein
MLLLDATVRRTAADDAFATPTDRQGADARIVDVGAIRGTAVHLIQRVIGATCVGRHTRARRDLCLRVCHNLGVRLGGHAGVATIAQTPSVPASKANQNQRNQSKSFHVISPCCRPSRVRTLSQSTCQPMGGAHATSTANDDDWQVFMPQAYPKPERCQMTGASIPIPAQVIIGLAFACLLLIAALEGRNN